MAVVDDTRTVSAVAHGVVQGVGFRWFIRERARERQLAGWVRNRDDGAVEFVVQGTAGRVAEFLRVAKVGPRGARVDRLEVDELTADADLPESFDIRR